MSMIPIARISQFSDQGLFTATFSNIPQNFTHLQLRISSKSTLAIDGHALNMTFNNVGGTSYVFQYFRADGSSVPMTNAFSQGAIELAGTSGANATDVYGAHIIDIYDYANTNKNKTIKSFYGYENITNAQLGTISAAFLSNNAITSISFYVGGGGAPIAAKSSFQLYGINSSANTGA